VRAKIDDLIVKKLLPAYSKYTYLGGKKQTAAWVLPDEQSARLYAQQIEAQDFLSIFSIVHGDIQQQVDNPDRVGVDETREVKEVLVRFELIDNSLCQEDAVGCDVDQSDADIILEHVFNIRE